MSAGKGADVVVLQEELHALDPRYKLNKIIGAGSYGVVMKGVDLTSGEPVAIKKISKVIFKDTRLAKRILREVKLLAHFHKNVVGEHRAENIIGLENLITPNTADFNEFWIIMELAESDLKSVFKSGQQLSLAQIQYMLYQMLHALKTMKAAGVIHRDITPANILVSYADLDIKICDFGLAREEPKDDDPYMTDYVTMRWYRAPELVMESKIYNEAVDIWGIGCILAEMFGSKPLFRGADRIFQLDKIIELVGSPSLEDIPSGSQAARRYVKERYIGPECKKGQRTRADWVSIFSRVSNEPQGSEAIDLLDKLLIFNPEKRITVEEALCHPFLSALHDEDDEETSDVPVFDFTDENLTNMEAVKSALYNETIEFHKANPHTIPRHLRARLRPGALQEDTEKHEPRTGYEGTLNPQDAEEDAEFESSSTQLPAECDLLLEMLSNLADEHRSATLTSSADALLATIHSGVQSSSGPVLSKVLSQYGWDGKGFARELDKQQIRHLIKDIRSAFQK
eukprot:TRINITY_DN8782_c0_g1_i1.p1 TRINITY_DN8782_c0_g1~~TRINITY_DN8782_c0_g1_i1.p1  ORF type:complete len:535 (+),score=117.95 TRINITY_DN8782_c0_g1_i1:71-1606(+)